ncbi:MAG: glycosyltransferase [Elusimicrobiales bacterium]|jgi:spore maturation protein CgeB
MTPKWNKKILAVLMQWDYGEKSRGPSGDAACFYENFKKLVGNVEPFWYDAYLHDIPALRRALMEKAESFNPDLIFFLPYTDQFDAGTLDFLKAKWATCAWFGDDTWRFERYSSKLAPHFTHVCTTDLFSVAKYRKLGVEPLLTQWAGQIFGACAGPMPSGSEFRYEVSFVGAYNQVRGWFIKTLAGLGVKVECFGRGWPNGKASFEEMSQIFRESRINLNLSNSVSRDLRFALGSFMNLARFLRSPKTAEQIKARNFEIPLAGGFQLTNYVPGLERYLKIGEEVSVYTTPEDCAGLIRYYLDNEKERFSIASSGCSRAVNEHTYFKRFQEIFAAVWGKGQQ